MFWDLLGLLIFTKLMRPLISKWRSHGIKILVYIDDGFGVADSKDIAQRQSTLTKQDLQSAGFLVQNEKCKWQVSQQLRWLGFDVDLRFPTISVPLEKVEALRAMIRNVLIWRKVTAHELCRLAGKILSLRLVLGDVCTILTKAIYLEIDC